MNKIDRDLIIAIQAIFIIGLLITLFLQSNGTQSRLEGIEKEIGITYPLNSLESRIDTNTLFREELIKVLNAQSQARQKTEE